MRHQKTVCLLLLTFLFACALDAKSQVVSQVGTPKFQFKDGSSLVIGKCFGLQWYRGRNLLIAPLHLLGPSGKRKFPLSQSQINSYVSQVGVMDLTGTRVVEVAKRSLLKANLATNQLSENAPGDMMAFELPARPHIPVLGLAAAMPHQQDRVAVLTYNFDHRNTEAWRSLGSVIETYAGYFVIQMDQPLSAASSDGAPIVNQQNQVLGMMIMARDPQRRYIVCAPCTTMYSRLVAEIGR